MAENFRSPRKVARRLKYLPLAIAKIRNWPAFMYHYALGLTPKQAYVFRNGARLFLSRAVDHVPVLEIFLDEDYGVIPDDSIILDLGAHIGVFSIYATTTARNVVVYAYEPYQEFYVQLEENVRLTQCDEAVRTFNYAVASEVGARNLYVKGEQLFFPTLAGATERKGQDHVVVRATTLAEIMESNRLEHVDLLKMDCEGAEYEILYSVPSSCLERIAEIRMEYHNLDSDEYHLEGLKRFFTRTGFVVTHVKPVTGTNGTLWAERMGALRRE